MFAFTFQSKLEPPPSPPPSPPPPNPKTQGWELGLGQEPSEGRGWGLPSCPPCWDRETHGALSPAPGSCLALPLASCSRALGRGAVLAGARPQDPTQPGPGVVTTVLSGQQLLVLN